MARTVGRWALGLATAAAIGVGWLVATWEPRPRPALRCGHDAAPDDCFVRVDGAAVLLGAQADDPGAPGHDPDAGPDEGPPVQAEVPSFWIQRTEATARTWRACVRAGACDAADVSGTGAFGTRAEADPVRDLLPVLGISWSGAADLCTFLGGRLPTEAEWELAARGPEGHRWPWGDDARCPASDEELAQRALRQESAGSCRSGGPAQVDDLEPAGPYGLIGLAGNAWEWTADPFAPHPRAPGAPLPDASERAQRGGSWLATRPEELRSTVRVGLEPHLRLADVGVRCVVGGPIR